LEAVDSDGRLTRRPRHSVNISARHRPAENLSLGISGLGSIDRMDIDPQSFATIKGKDYFVANFVADWDVTEQWSLYGRVENLFDKFYEPAAGYPALGRSGYLGARYRF
jgi:vitamin B12 transporter